jgi:hypothetical protein
MRYLLATLLSAVVALGLTACASEDQAVSGEPEPREVVLGPADGHDLPGTDLDRVAVGDVAPDFGAMTLAGEPIQLSHLRGEKNVVLFFYRGHW